MDFKFTFSKLIKERNVTSICSWDSFHLFLSIFPNVTPNVNTFSQQYKDPCTTSFWAARSFLKYSVINYHISVFKVLEKCFLLTRISVLIFNIWGWINTLSFEDKIKLSCDPAECRFAQNCFPRGGIQFRNHPISDYVFGEHNGKREWKNL